MISNKVIAKSVRKMKIAHLPGIKRALAESVKSAGVIHNAQNPYLINVPPKPSHANSV